MMQPEHWFFRSTSQRRSLVHKKKTDLPLAEKVGPGKQVGKLPEGHCPPKSLNTKSYLKAYIGGRERPYPPVMRWTLACEPYECVSSSILVQMITHTEKNSKSAWKPLKSPTYPLTSLLIWALVNVEFA